MLTQSEDYLEKQRERHETSGAFRSGEGTPQQIAQRRKEREEKLDLKRLYESKAVTFDYKLN